LWVYHFKLGGLGLIITSPEAVNSWRWASQYGETCRQKIYQKRPVYSTVLGRVRIAALTGEDVIGTMH